MSREHLSIKVSTTGAKKSERELDRLETQGGKTERARQYRQSCVQSCSA